MPEGHTLHRLAATLTDAFAGRTTRSSSPQGRFAEQASAIDGFRFSNAHAYGKHLFCQLAPTSTNADTDTDTDTDPGVTVHIHLGLAGKLAVSNGFPPVVGTVRWRLTTDPDSAGPAATADLRGPLRCELLTASEVAEVITSLGPDPLRADSDPDVGWQRVRRSSQPIAALLMDQKVAAGVGNIYRAEVLYRQRLNPFTPGTAIKAGQWQALWDDLCEQMRRGVHHGRIDTVYPEHEPAAMNRPPRIDAHGGEVYVYRRAHLPCLVCGSRVKTQPLAGRNLFWCGRCQRIGSRRKAS